MAFGNATVCKAGSICAVYEVSLSYACSGVKGLNSAFEHLRWIPKLTGETRLLTEGNR